MNRSLSPLDEAKIRLFRTVEERIDEVVSLVRQLVEFDSTLGNELQAQEFVAGFLRESGYSASLWEIDEEIVVCRNGGKSGVPMRGRPNVTARIVGSGQGHTLVLNGHIDVVSAEPVAAWETPPYSPTLMGDRLFGRGAWDMKSGIAMNLMLARMLNDLGIELGGDLLIQSVIEEECTGNGALAAAIRDNADAALISESTNQAFTRAHVGVAWFTVSVEGRAWHAMQATQGVNAIEKSVPLIEALRRLDEELNRESHPLYTEIDHPINLNIGVFQSGDWPSTVPGHAEITCRVSVFPGQSMEQLRSRIEQVISDAAESDDWLCTHRPEVRYHGFGSAGSTIDITHPLVRLMDANHLRIEGKPLQYVSSTGICDMKAFNLNGIPCGCYGAKGGNAHAANEWLDVTSLAPALKVIGATVLDWCGVSHLD